MMKVVAIIIEDNGPGIPDKNYEDVFKPFFTLDPSRNKLKGESGLGIINYQRYYKISWWRY